MLGNNSGGGYRGTEGTYVPGANKEGTPKEGYGNFLRHEINKNFVSSVEAGMGMKGQIMHNTMHILDVISSVSRSSKYTKIVGGGASPQTPLGR